MAVVLAVILPFQGCMGKQSAEEKINSSDMASDNQKKTGDQQTILEICIEGEPRDGGYDGAKISTLFKNLARVLSRDGITYEIVETPSALREDGQEERTAFLERMRVEMMAGNGPDIFVLPTISSFSADNLFINIEKAMAVGNFADLSSYYQGDASLKEADLCAPVMNAGLYDDKQYLLPLRYTYPLSIVLKDTFDESKISYDTAVSSAAAYMDEVKKTGNLKWTRELAELLASNFLYTLGDTVDYWEQRTLLSPNELEEAIAAYCQFAQGIGPEDPKGYMQNIGKVAVRREVLSPERPMFVSSLGARILPILGELTLENQQYLSIPLTNSAGKVVPQVTYFAAVSASCKVPDAAYRYISTLLSKEVQSGGELLIETTKGSETIDTSAFDTYSEWPVRKDISFQEIWGTYAAKYHKGNENINGKMQFEPDVFSVPYDLFVDGACLTNINHACNTLLLEYFYAENPLDQTAQQKIFDVLHKHIQAAAME